MEMGAGSVGAYRRGVERLAGVAHMGIGIHTYDLAVCRCGFGYDIGWGPNPSYFPGEVKS